MSNRFLVYYAFALIFVLAFSYYQNLYYPAVPAEAKIAAQQDEADSKEQNDESADQSDAVDDSAENADSPDQPGNTATQGDASDPATSNQADSDSTPPADVAEQPADVGELYTIGSLDPASKYRFLVTLNSNGGTVRRVELNLQNKQNRFRYRDLEYEAGYLGELDCIDSTDGCEVRIVGPGTPAAIAGVKQGDIVDSMDAKPVVSATDFLAMLSETKPGQSVSLSIRRGDESLDFEIPLIDKPIELIRPQPDILGKGWLGLPSFQTSLRQYSPQKPIWPELDPTMRQGKWNLTSQTEDQISFEYEVTADVLKNNSDIENSGLTGPLTIKKTYRIPASIAQQLTDFERDFHIDFDFQIINKSDSAQKFCYQLDGPLGTPSETWWYQNKIHGETWAFLKTAGARDVVGLTGQEDFIFFGGPAIVANMRKTAPEFFWVLSPPSDADPASQNVKYLSVDSQYFNVSLLPKSEEQPFSAYSVFADITDLGGATIPKDAKEQKLVDVTFRMFKDVELEANQSYNQSFEIFCGPKEGELLKLYSLDSVRTFGWFSMFSKPLCWLLKLLHTLTFQLGYGIPIILLTMIVRSLMIPISRKAAINAQMMQYLQPQMKEIADKYKDDMEKRGQAQRDLFKRYKYNPFSGCVMMFFQLPIFIGLYRGLSVDIALRDQPLFPGMSWASNLSAPDQLWYWKDAIPISFLTGETGWLGPYLNVLPIITCILFVVQQKLFTPPPTDEQQEMMQNVMKYAMIFMGLLFFKVPAGLCLYFITSSMWGIAERKMLPKPELNTSKLDALDGDSKPLSTVQEAKLKIKQDLEEQKKNDEQEEKKRRDKERKKKLKHRGS